MNETKLGAEELSRTSEQGLPAGTERRWAWLSEAGAVPIIIESVEEVTQDVLEVASCLEPLLNFSIVYGPASTRRGKLLRDTIVNTLPGYRIDLITSYLSILTPLP